MIMLLITVIVEACTAGLPAIASGDFAIVGFSDICKPLAMSSCAPQVHLAMPICSSAACMGDFIAGAQYMQSAGISSK